MQFLDIILDIIFPPQCIACKKSGAQLCSECLGKFPKAERECANWIFPLFDYRHPPIKNAVWLLKYKGKKNVAQIFAALLYGRILEELSDLSLLENFQDPILIPIPLARARQKERGFNQAELICQNLIAIEKSSKNSNFKLEKEILIKPADSAHQARIENREERLRNIVGSFSVVNPEKIKERNIILIDDVTTTGATLNEARKILKLHGAKKIIAFTVAH